MNYAQFQDKIEVSRAISVIKDLTCLVENSSKVPMKNDMLDFNVIKLFGINTCSDKVLRLLLVRWEFLLSGWVKINTDGVARGILVLLLIEVFFMGVWENVLVFSLRFLKFGLLLLLSFMESYMIWRKLKRCVAFTVKTNVPWMLRNRWNTCLNYCGKIRFRVTHIFREGNLCVDKLANLRFIYR